MRKLIGLIVGMTSALALSSQCFAQTLADAEAISSRPNILLVVADDMGTYDIGAFGSEIRTPNIDSLASAGVRFTEFHTSATCSPTRAMLLSGADSHAAGMGNMIEHISPNQLGQPGYEGYLSDRVVSVATLLQDAGYRTYMAGKWHLGKQPEQLPASRGFDESFVLLEGGASYFNDMMGLNAIVKEANYRRNLEVVTELPDDFYASEDYADFIIEQIEAGSNPSTESDQPFFAYLAFSAPHWPLQVRDQHVDLYKGQYDQGYDVLLQQRLTRAAALGVLAEDVVAAERPAHVLPWNELDPEQQKTQAKTMEIYAAVVERMDFHLGRVMRYLENSGQMDNTLVIFMSDNGADGSDRSKLPGNDVWLPEAWDLSYENMGKIGSYVYPGAAWARTSVGPSSMYKEFLAQGGIKAPLIISYPKAQNKSTQNDGAQNNEFVSVKDITPTILDITDTAQPGTSYKGREVTPIEGISLLPALQGESQAVSDMDRSVGWELFGQKAIRKGDWKLLWLSSKPGWLVQPANADYWRLYNLAQDPGETQNLALQEPEKLAEMRQLWDEYSEQQDVILPVWQAH